MYEYIDGVFYTLKILHIEKYALEKNNYNMKYRVVTKILLFRFLKS